MTVCDFCGRKRDGEFSFSSIVVLVVANGDVEAATRLVRELDLCSHCGKRLRCEIARVIEDWIATPKETARDHA